MTKGEYRVGINFNPDNNDLVWQIKNKAAELIDLIDSIEPKSKTLGGTQIEVIMSTYAAEIGRLKNLAMSSIEQGAMWAVKAVTKPEFKEDE